MIIVVAFRRSHYAKQYTNTIFAQILISIFAHRSYTRIIFNCYSNFGFLFSFSATESKKKKKYPMISEVAKNILKIIHDHSAQTRDILSIVKSSNSRVEIIRYFHVNFFFYCIIKVRQRFI